MSESGEDGAGGREPAEPGPTGMDGVRRRDAAVAGLVDALTRLEAAVQRRQSVDLAVTHHEEVIQRLNDDRAELARRLDRAEARAERLEEANRTVSHRLVGAMERVRAILEGAGRGGAA